MQVSTIRESLVVERGTFCWFEERFPLLTDEHRLLNIRNRLKGLAWFVPRNGFMLTRWLNKLTTMVRGHRDTEHRTQDTQEHVHGHNDKTNTRHRTQTRSRTQFHSSGSQVHTDINPNHKSLYIRWKNSRAGLLSSRAKPIYNTAVSRGGVCYCTAKLPALLYYSLIAMTK